MRKKRDVKDEIENVKDELEFQSVFEKEKRKLEFVRICSYCGQVLDKNGECPNRCCGFE